MGGGVVPRKTGHCCGSKRGFTHILSRVVAQLAGHFIWDEEVASSSLAYSTIMSVNKNSSPIKLTNRKQQNQKVTLISKCLDQDIKSVTYGSIVQQVRAPACHAGSCRFKSDSSHHCTQHTDALRCPAQDVKLVNSRFSL